MEVVFLLASDGPTSYESFRPNLNNQWWSRRDALVRCTAQGLYAYERGIKSVNFFFGEDMSILCMNPKLKTHITTPCERDLISVWRTAAAGSKSCPDGIYFMRDLWKSGSVLKTVSTGDLPSDAELEKLDKRQLLEMIQKKASIDFLRENRLNASPAVVLKKTNAPALKELLKKCYGPSCLTPSVEETSPSATNLEFTFQAFLSHVRATHVVTLHEDAQFELPLFHRNLPSSSDTKGVIVCILGAVRDLKKEEELAILNAANSLKLPCLSVNLGRTAEFTSKIISVLAASSFTGRLADAVVHLLAVSPKNNEEVFKKLAPVRGWTWNGDKTTFASSHERCEEGQQSDLDEENGVKRKWESQGEALMPKRKMKKMLMKQSEEEQKKSESTPPPLKVVLKLNDLNKEQLIEKLKSSTNHAASSTPSEESYLSVYPIVSLAVCALWRSKLGREGSKDTEKECSITFSFADEEFAIVTQSMLVHALASKHEAAPSEVQVLEGLIECLKAEREEKETKSVKRLVKGLKASASSSLIVRLSMNFGVPVSHFYNSIYTRRECTCRDGESSKDDDTLKSVILVLGEEKKAHADEFVVNGRAQIGVGGWGGVSCWLQQLGYHGVLESPQLT
eukprot:GDKJ01009810.1.p1 GENE.GDKJ01009810.1~~GDKJ01009810.1.p1  ORF type:complete len:622 (-),score=144.17 GDKJ01009810.1:53-1918(-)